MYILKLLLIDFANIFTNIHKYKLKKPSNNLIFFNGDR